MKWFILFMPVLAYAMDVTQWSERWSTVVRLSDRHESYVSGEMIKAPVGTWQLLLSAIIAENPPAGFSKDCVFVKVPEKADGEVRIISVEPTEDCKEHQMKAARVHITNLKGIQYQIKEQTIQLWLTESGGRVQQFKARMLNIAASAKPELHQSSQNRGVFYFVPNSEIKIAASTELIGELEDGYPQNPCRYSDGSCQRCRYGVYRLSSGEYFCGVDRCGEKNQPACWRGTHWQRSRDTFSCRTNDSLVFCSPGLRVECEGERALCR